MSKRAGICAKPIVISELKPRELAFFLHLMMPGQLDIENATQALNEIIEKDL